jgi:uncharacterized protein
VISLKLPIVVYQGAVMTEFTTILFVLIGVIIGFVAGRATSRAGDATKLHNELTRARKELSQYKREMGDHFTSTAVMFEQLDEHYQRLSQHFAEQSQKLLPQANPLFRNETKDDGLAVASEAVPETQPLDYSGERSGLLAERSKLG